MDLVPVESPAHHYVALPGGSPANTALALARLGVPALLLARLSRDASGQLLRAHLTKNGVDLSLAVDAAEPTSLALVQLERDGAATYRFLLEGAADWQWRDEELPPLDPDVVAVHGGSLSLARPPGGQAIERFLARCRSHCTISIDPNLRPGLLGDLADHRADVQRWLQLADLFKASTDDIALLHPGENPLDVAQRWARSGPGLVIVTCAGDGAFAVHADTIITRPAVPTSVVDTVAAGDTFTAGLLSHLHRLGVLGARLSQLPRDAVEASLDRALQAAAITCGRVGADPPWASELSR